MMFSLKADSIDLLHLTTITAQTQLADIISETAFKCVCFYRFSLLRTRASILRTKWSTMRALISSLPHCHKIIFKMPDF